MRILVTGGAGMIGSHLCRRLLRDGHHEVICVDDFSTSDGRNIEDLRHDERFSVDEFSVSDPSWPAWSHRDYGSLDAIAHLASAASPKDYQAQQVRTLAAGAEGTMNCLDLAVHQGARFLLASTSEVYGNPERHPQHESYNGNVSPTGPRSMYDEAKRFAEAATMAYHRENGVDTRIARIFNTVGPGVRPDDGRLVPSLITQALRDEPLTVHGDGDQTRSISYVLDVVDALERLLTFDVPTQYFDETDIHAPVNIGNPEEHTVLEIATRVLSITRSESPIVFIDRPEGDPDRRCPSIERARHLLGWGPTTKLDDTLRSTIRYLAGVLSREAMPA